MAKCDEGYRCDVCGRDVDDITQSDLYLRFVLGEVDPETLHLSAERHIRCNPTLAQFIVYEGFTPVIVDGPFARASLDPEWTAEEEARVTAAYLRLNEIFTSAHELPITEYPLPGVADLWRTQVESAVERFERFNRIG